MKTLKIRGKTLRTEDFGVSSVVEVESGLEVDTPSLLINLLRLRKKMKDPVHGFEYEFPMTFDPTLETNGFKATFPIIFEEYV